MPASLRPFHLKHAPDRGLLVAAQPPQRLEAQRIKRAIGAEQIRSDMKINSLEASCTF